MLVFTSLSIFFSWINVKSGVWVWVSQSIATISTGLWTLLPSSVLCTWRRNTNVWSSFYLINPACQPQKFVNIANFVFKTFDKECNWFCMVGRDCELHSLCCWVLLCWPRWKHSSTSVFSIQVLHLCYHGYSKLDIIIWIKSVVIFFMYIVSFVQGLLSALRVQLELMLLLKVKCQFKLPFCTLPLYSHLYFLSPSFSLKVRLCCSLKYIICIYLVLFPSAGLLLYFSYTAN